MRTIADRLVAAARERPWIVAACLFAGLLIARHLHDGFSAIVAEEARLAQQGQVLFVRGGDVWMRDLPKTHQFLAGRFFSDPHFEGEPHWYPFFMPLAAAAVARIGGYEPASAYFRLEVMTTALFLLAIGLHIRVVAGRLWVALLPVAGLLGWILPGNGLYPIYGARGPLLILLAASGWVIDQAATTRMSRQRAFWLAGAVGLANGVLGLWNGAAFFLCLPVTVLVAVWLGGRMDMEGRRPFERVFPLAAAVAACTLAMALLLLPQLIHYGTIQQAQSARLYVETAIYGPGNHWQEAFAGRLWPTGLARVLLWAFFALLALSAWSPRVRGLIKPTRALPLAFAYLLAMAVAHVGYGLNDPALGAGGVLLRTLLPAPPHGFYIVAGGALFPVIQILAVGWTFLLLWQLAVERLKAKIPPKATLVLADPRRAWLAAAATAVLWIAMLIRFDSRIGFFWQGEDLAFYRFARQAHAITGNRVVYTETPARMVTVGGIRVLAENAPDHVNHYVLAQRLATAAELRALVARRNYSAADQLLARNNVAFVLAGPGNLNQVVDHCGGNVLIQFGTYRLRERAACHP